MTKRAQELFLEVAHYLPEKGARSVVARLQQAVQDALGDVTLDHPLSRGQVLDCLSAVHAGDMLLHAGVGSHRPIHLQAKSAPNVWNSSVGLDWRWGHMIACSRRYTTPWVM